MLTNFPPIVNCGSLGMYPLTSYQRNAMEAQIRHKRRYCHLVTEIIDVASYNLIPFITIRESKRIIIQNYEGFLTLRSMVTYRL